MKRIERRKDDGSGWWLTDGSGLWDGVTDWSPTDDFMPSECCPTCQRPWDGLS